MSRKWLQQCIPKENLIEWANDNWKTQVFLRQNENNWHYTFSDGWLPCETILLVRNFVSTSTVLYWMVQDLSCPTHTRLKEFYCITQYNLNDFIKVIRNYYYIITTILPCFHFAPPHKYPACPPLLHTFNP